MNAQTAKITPNADEEELHKLEAKRDSHSGYCCCDFCINYDLLIAPKLNKLEWDAKAKIYHVSNGADAAIQRATGEQP